MNQKRIAAILALTSLSLGGCGGGVRSTLPSLASAGTYGAPAATGSGKIEHVVLGVLQMPLSLRLLRKERAGRLIVGSVRFDGDDLPLGIAQRRELSPKGSQYRG